MQITLVRHRKETFNSPYWFIYMWYIPVDLLRLAASFGAVRRVTVACRLL